MKKSLILSLVTLLILSTVIGGMACSSSSSTGIAGTYINENDASEYIEIREDDTFHAEGGGMEFNGEWEVEGSEISFYWDDSVTTGTIEDDKIIESDGTVWIKQANCTEPVTYKSSDIGADGGTLELTASDGTTCSLTIPSGVLTETTNIKITVESSSKGSSLGALSNDFFLEPEGLTFEVPVTISITVPNSWSADQAAAILHTVTDGQSILLDTQVDGLTLSATLDHFSHATPVAPTEDDLYDYLGLIELNIEGPGLSVDNVYLVRELGAVYSFIQGNSNVYPGIDLAYWRDQLWEYMNDMIITGSLECTSGNYLDAEYLLEAASEIAFLLQFSDLLAEADQALQDCQQLSGNSFPEIYFRISDPTGGVGEIFINDWCLARADQSAWYHDTGWVHLRETDPQGNPWADQYGLVLTVKFLVRPRTGSRSDIPSSYFELKVNGQVTFSERLSANKGETFEQSTTLAFPNVTP